MNRAKANSLTRKMQGVAIAFAAAAGAVAAGVIPMSAPSNAAAVTPVPVAPVKPPEPPVDVNTQALAAALDLIAPPVVIKDKPPAEDIKPPVTAAAWKYLGAIISGSYKRAVVTVNEKQQLVGEGTKVNETEVTEITPAYILLKDSAGAEQKIDLEVKQKTQLTIAAPTYGGARSAALAPGRQPFEQTGLQGVSPELAEQITKAVAELRGIKGLSDEDQREKLRGMFPNDKFDVEAAFASSGGGKGDGKGGGKGENRLRGGGGRGGK